MVKTDLPSIHLPGEEKYQSYKVSLQDYCSKIKASLPNYLPERRADGSVIGTLSFCNKVVKCKTVAASLKEADNQAAYQALKQLGYLKGKKYVPLPTTLKRKENEAMETDAAKQIKVTAKGHLLHLCQRHHLGDPTYNTVEVPMPSTRGYFSTVNIGETAFKSMAIHTKKMDAEQDAAQVALDAAQMIQEAGGPQVNNAGKNAGDKPPPSTKSRLHEYCQKQRLEITYEIERNEEEGTYSAMVNVNGTQYFGISCLGKKAAQASAAEVALISLGISNG